MRLYLEKRVIIGLIVALAVLSCLGVLSFLNNKKFIEASGRIAHTNDVLYHAEQLLAVMVDMETGQRGYAITGNEIFLEPYKAAILQTEDHWNRLQTLTGDNPNQQTILNSVRPLIDKKIEFTKNAVSLRNVGFEDKTEALEGKLLMDGIRQKLSEFEAREKELLEVRTRIGEEQIFSFNLAFGSLLLVIVTILTFIFYLVNVNLRARIIAEHLVEKKASEVQDLYDNAPCGYYSLDINGVFVSINNTLLLWLQRKREEVINRIRIIEVMTLESAEVFLTNFVQFKLSGSVSNMEFEFLRKDGSVMPVILNAVAVYDKQKNYLRSRSTVFDLTERKIAEDKIKKANQELEGFSYSVSHDLRAPLRSIDGYSQILKEDHSSQLGEEGNRVLSIIIRNAKSMGQLIDDLLDFSRLGRLNIHPAVISFEGLVRNLAEELAEEEKKKGRSVELTIYPLEEVRVDVDMIRQVWVNLLSNAFKYSSKKDVAKIEIGSYSTDGEVIFYVKDNGTGFDEQYIHKLFGVFQRLHKTKDFPGTGVGLAIVKRIVERHGGRVWAESAIGQGATFYFSILNHQSL